MSDEQYNALRKRYFTELHKLENIERIFSHTELSIADAKEYLKDRYNVFVSDDFLVTYFEDNFIRRSYLDDFVRVNIAVRFTHKFYYKGEMKIKGIDVECGGYSNIFRVFNIFGKVSKQYNEEDFY